MYHPELASKIVPTFLSFPFGDAAMPCLQPGPGPCAVTTHVRAQMQRIRSGDMHDRTATGAAMREGPGAGAKTEMHLKSTGRETGRQAKRDVHLCYTLLLSVHLVWYRLQ